MKLGRLLYMPVVGSAGAIGFNVNFLIHCQTGDIVGADSRRPSGRTMSIVKPSFAAASSTIALRFTHGNWLPLFSGGRRGKVSSSFTSLSTDQPVEKVLVVGAGAIGLRTALELLRRNISVILEAPRHPLHPATCSMGAGGLWMPFHVEDDRATRWAKETLDELYMIAADPDNGLVEIVPTVVLMRDPKAQDCLPDWTTNAQIEFQCLTVDQLSQQNTASTHRLLIPPEQELRTAGYTHSWFFRPPIVDAPRMLERLLQQVAEYSNATVNVETGNDFVSAEQMRDHAASLECDAVVNCTGLGAAEICQDPELVGARGILLQFERLSCARREAVAESNDGRNTNDAVIMTDEVWGSETLPCYLIPRGDLILVGGSYLEGDGEESIRDCERSRLLSNANRMGIDVEHCDIVGEWTGFRPFRTKVRCELDIDASSSTPHVKVVHSYGYGGSGWTVNVGAAKECADILLGRQR